jgi:hypothetical protein
LLLNVKKVSEVLVGTSGLTGPTGTSEYSTSAVRQHDLIGFGDFAFIVSMAVAGILYKYIYSKRYT